MRRVHRVLCYLILSLLVLQFFWIGLATLGRAENPGLFPLHVLGGYLATLLALVAVLVAAVGRREALVWSVGLLGVLILQILLARLAGPLPVVGALHPVNALVALFFGGAAARGAPMGHRALRGDRERGEGNEDRASQPRSSTAA
jgi:hypothetical protein